MSVYFASVTSKPGFRKKGAHQRLCRPHIRLLNQSRLLKFKQSLTENLGEEESIETAKVQFLSMQQVIVDESRIEDLSSLVLRTKWNYDEILGFVILCAAPAKVTCTQAGPVHT
ncbi:hypothetical protein F441_14747 [Phytophthora nicotianae CJ01A1]|uniref:Uncharacterized protein n=2 Tax=Phytophthora nicotianae TaxID=4792 RepID=W2IGC0_PHYNI|nr:hypothetical protein L915_14502 [Phytophthora nicotianae]ETL33085.1 hypothetical protein L916_14408 [Phytophthora nicotianae]ETP09376.1 hypothetical protein F441_14747 [Phytophthora nicotianae CJ01A1]